MSTILWKFGSTIYTTNHGTEMKPKINRIVGIPFAVVLEAPEGRWEITTNRGGADSPPLRFVLKERKSRAIPEKIYLDAFAVRDRFMSLKTEEETLDFLNGCGEFSSYLQDPEGGWHLKDFRLWRKVFTELARRPPDRWKEYLSEELPESDELHEYAFFLPILEGTMHRVIFKWGRDEHLSWSGSKNLAVLRTFNVVSAIVTSIEVDHLRGAKFGVCARNDCRAFFEITSQHSRKYCTIYCAHLESVRRTRARRKQGKASRSRASRERVSSSTRASTRVIRD